MRAAPFGKIERRTNPSRRIAAVPPVFAYYRRFLLRCYSCIMMITPLLLLLLLLTLSSCGCGSTCGMVFADAAEQTPSSSSSSWLARRQLLAHHQPILFHDDDDSEDHPQLLLDANNSNNANSSVASRTMILLGEKNQTPSEDEQDKHHADSYDHHQYYNQDNNKRRLLMRLQLLRDEHEHQGAADEPNNNTTNRTTKNEISSDNEEEEEESGDGAPFTSWRLVESVRGGGESVQPTESSVYADAVSESSGASRNDGWDEQQISIDRWAARLVRGCAWIVAWQSLVTLLSSSSMGRDELLLEVCGWVSWCLRASKQTPAKTQRLRILLYCWHVALLLLTNLEYSLLSVDLLRTFGFSPKLL